MASESRLPIAIFVALTVIIAIPFGIDQIRDRRRPVLVEARIVTASTTDPVFRDGLRRVAPGNKVEAFLAAGHVCTVMGYEEYEPIAEKYRVPIVVTGFEPLDLLHGIHMTVEALEQGRWGVENQYTRSVRLEGNPQARSVIEEMLEPCDRQWRGIGEIPRSGMRLREKYAGFDAERKFGVGSVTSQESPLCIAGEILQGLKKPHECSQFGSGCTPERPLGAPMVSNEGACAAYYRYGRNE